MTARSARRIPHRLWNWLAPLVCILAMAVPGFAQQPAGAEANAQEQPAKQAEQNNQRYWTTRWEFEEIDVAKLFARLKAIGIDLGLDLEGTVSVQFDVGIPWTALNDGAAYRFAGTLTSPRLIVESVELRDLETVIRYQNGVAKLTRLASSIVDADSDATGKINGTGSLELLPRRNATAELNVDDISIAPIGRLLAKLFPDQRKLFPSSGQFSGNVKFEVPIKQVADIASYQLAGKLSGRDVKVEPLPPTDVRVGRVVIHNGRLQIDSLDLEATNTERGPSDLRFFARADLPLGETGHFSFRVAGDDLPLADLAAIASRSASGRDDSPIHGKLDFHLTGTGTLDPKLEQSDWTIDGSVASPSLSIAGLDLGLLEHDVQFTADRFVLRPRRDPASLPPSFKLQKIEANYQISEDALRLPNLNMDAFGGQIEGAVTIPRGDVGDLVADVTIQSMRPELRIPVSGNRSPKVTATLGGDVHWRVPVGKIAEPSAHQGTASLSARRIEIAGQPVGELMTRLDAQAGAITIQADGELFGGQVAVRTVGETLAQDRWSDLAKRLTVAQFRFDGVAVDALLGMVLDRRSEFSGSVSGDLSVDFRSINEQAFTIPDATVSLELSRVSYRSVLFSRRLTLKGRVENNLLWVNSIVGDYAGGSIRFKGRVPLLDDRNAFHPRADLEVSASRVDLRQGLWFLGEKADELSGRVSGRATLSGNLESIRIRGNVDGRDLQAYAMPIGVAHSSLVANADLRSWKWNLEFPAVRSSVGGGQLEGEMYLESAVRGGFNLASRWKTRRVDFFRLTNQLGQSSTLASGDISGELSLRGKSVKSIEDLSGRFAFQLDQTRGAAIPGLTAASEFLGPVSLATQSFDSGEARGIIGKGVIVIDEFWLSSRSALVRADGKVYLRSGRMDLKALIATGDYRDVAIDFSKIAQQYALNTLVPASAILSVSELLRDRTIVLAVGGTLQNPIVRLRPVETFREETARFLLREGQRLIVAGIASEVTDNIDGWDGPF